MLAPLRVRLLLRFVTRLTFYTPASVVVRAALARSRAAPRAPHIFGAARGVAQPSHGAAGQRAESATECNRLNGAGARRFWQRASLAASRASLARWTAVPRAALAATQFLIAGPGELARGARYLRSLAALRLRSLASPTGPTRWRRRSTRRSRLTTMAR